MDLIPKRAKKRLKDLNLASGPRSPFWSEFLLSALLNSFYEVPVVSVITNARWVAGMNVLNRAEHQSRLAYLTLNDTFERSECHFAFGADVTCSAM